jgi:hypothetical protein
VRNGVPGVPRSFTEEPRAAELKLFRRLICERRKPQHALRTGEERTVKDPRDRAPCLAKRPDILRLAGARQSAGLASRSPARRQECLRTQDDPIVNERFCGVGNTIKQRGTGVSVIQYERRLLKLVRAPETRWKCVDFPLIPTSPHFFRRRSSVSRPNGRGQDLRTDDRASGAAFLRSPESRTLRPTVVQPMPCGRGRFGLTG